MRPVARRTDPSTSHEAAWSLRDLTDIQLNILALFDDIGPMTDEALVDAYRHRHGAIGPSTVRTRRRELQDLGEVEVSGRSTTKGGRPCQEFRLTQSTLFPA